MFYDLKNKNEDQSFIDREATQGLVKDVMRFDIPEGAKTTDAGL